MFTSRATTQQMERVDRFNQEKLYIQVARILINEIIGGRWKINDRIPSEDELCQTYQVSKTTVRQAINNLVADGYLMKIQGKGTYVTGNEPLVGFAMRTRSTVERFGKEVFSERTIDRKSVV
jgi:DNA-binding GntR family transcriptional regulator